MSAQVAELTKRAILKDFRSGLSKTDLSRKYHLSYSTIKRITKGVVVEEVAKDIVVRRAIAQRVDGVTRREEVLDTDELLRVAIADIASDIPSTQSKSKEGAATALVRLIDAYRKYNPLTMDELVELALSVPGFDPREFAQKLRDRIEPRAV